MKKTYWLELFGKLVCRFGVDVETAPETNAMTKLTCELEKRNERDKDMFREDKANNRLQGAS